MSFSQYDEQNKTTSCTTEIHTYLEYFGTLIKINSLYKIEESSMFVTIGKNLIFKIFSGVLRALIQVLSIVGMHILFFMIINYVETYVLAFWI